jgi:5-formyltetrahydrofolate cyclo-ligase
MLKSEARQYYKHERTSLKDTDKARLDDLILIQFQKVKLPQLEYVLSYWPMDTSKEINTHTITRYLEFKNPGLKILYTRTDFTKKNMTALLTDEETIFKKNKFNIYEPENGEEIKASQIDLVLVPMLIFDKSGHRVGYGQGFYDRYLPNCRADCIKTGLCYFEPIEKVDDANHFDVTLNLCITPRNIYVF